MIVFKIMSEHFRNIKVDTIKTSVSFAIIISFLMIVYALIYKVIPIENKEALIHVLGIIEGALISIVSFYFGSSKGSQQKQDVINDTLAKK